MIIEAEGYAIGKIQDGIPVPPRPGGKASKLRLAIEELEPGQSRTFRGFSSKQLVQTCASIRKKLPGWQFIVRSVSDDVVRVWREK